MRCLRTLGFAVALTAMVAAGFLLNANVALALNCSDFVSQAAAQARLREDPTDPDRIDADGDGLACENNPGPYDYDPVPNPLRTTAQTSAFLRTSLGVAVMGFRISDLVIALGAFLIVVGVLNVLIMAPAAYWASVVADEHEKTREKETVAGQAPATPQAT